MFTKYEDSAEIEITEAYRYEDGAEVEAEAAYKYEDGTEKEAWSGAYEFTKTSSGTSNGYGRVDYNGNNDLMEFRLYAATPDSASSGTAHLTITCSTVDNIVSGEAVRVSATFNGFIEGTDLSAVMRCYDSSNSHLGSGTDTLYANTKTDTLSFIIHSVSADVAKVTLGFQITARGNVTTAEASGALSDVTINGKKCKFT